jgi:acyl-CoA synthetase (NDP forming)
MTKPTSPDWVSMVSLAQGTAAPAVVTAAQTWSGEELLGHAATGSDPAGGALLAQAGVIHTTTLEDMFDVALLLANQPVPAGSRAAIVTNAMDPGVLAAACTAGGLTVASLSDLRPTAAPGDYLAAMAAVLADPAVDSVIVIFMPPPVRAVEKVAAAIMNAARGANGKPVVASFMSSYGLLAGLRNEHQAISSYVIPRTRRGRARPGSGIRPVAARARRSPGLPAGHRSESGP